MSSELPTQTSNSAVLNNKTVVRSAVLGAAGYSGAELCALLTRNPYFELCFAYASAGRKAEPFSSLYPRFQQQVDVLVEPWTDDEIDRIKGTVDHR
jgi:N-acetyl-gamma-glutamyl-phosphate reductase